MYKAKILALVLSALVLASCSNATLKTDISPDGTLSATVETLSAKPTEQTEDGYLLAAKNENFSLYYEAKGLTVRVVNNKTGAVTDSAATPNDEMSLSWKNFVNSGLVLEYFKEDSVNLNKINMYSGSPTTRVSLIENGFSAKVDFKGIGISLTMLVTLDNNGIRVQIPNSFIKETKEKFRLAAIYVLPFLGYTRGADIEGYMFIPDGCGALIELKDNNEKFSQPYKAKIYGGNYSVEANTTAVQKYDDTIATASDTAEVFAPVFGMVHTSKQNAVLGIIESGKTGAEIYAYPNGVITEYNWISARYVYREIYQYMTGQTGSIRTAQENRETFDISVAYRFTGGEDANYVGLAKSYRDYLTETGVFKSKTDESYSMRLDFFAGDREKALLGKRFVPMTTVEQLGEILNSFVKNGVDKLSVSLKGWQKGGIYGAIGEKPTFESKLGDYKDYVELAKKYSQNAEFMLYGDFLNTYTKSGSKDYIYQYNGKVFSSDTFLELNPTKYRFTADAVIKRVDKLSARLQESDVIGLSFDGVTSEVYSYQSGEKQKMYSRKTAAEAHNRTLSLAGEKLNTAYTSPNDYLWGSTQKYYDYLIYGSDYKFVTREVPFFAIVLKGNIPLYSEYINFKADTVEYKLKLIESGVYPSFLLSYESPSKLIYTDSASLFSCEYSEYSEMIAEYNEIFKKLSSIIKNSKIADHSSKNGLSVTSYDNGATVVVNYNKTAVEYNGKAVDGQSYLLLDGKAVQ